MSESTIKNCFEKFGFSKPGVMADETGDHEFDEFLQELCSNATVEEFLEFDDCVDTCEPVVNTLPVDWRQELRAECIQSVINPNAESEYDGSELEEDVDDAIEINTKPAVNTGIASAMLDKLQFFFDENDEKNEVLRGVVLLTKKARKYESNQRNKKLSTIFLSNDFM